MYVQNFSQFNSQPLIWFGTPRQTESLYNYQTHHHQLTVVDDLINVRYAKCERTTLNVNLNEVKYDFLSVFQNPVT